MTSACTANAKACPTPALAWGTPENKKSTTQTWRKKLQITKGNSSFQTRDHQPIRRAKSPSLGLLNFDRVWEGTMSDIFYSPEICRNIMVDARYILFVIDKFAGAKNLIEEMTIVYPKSQKAK